MNHSGHIQGGKTQGSPDLGDKSFAPACQLGSRAPGSLQSREAGCILYPGPQENGFNGTEMLGKGGVPTTLVYPELQGFLEGASWIRAPTEVHILILGICECVTLDSKRDFADVNKFVILEWEGYPVLFRWPEGIMEAYTRGEQEGLSQREEEALKMGEGPEATGWR